MASLTVNLVTPIREIIYRMFGFTPKKSERGLTMNDMFTRLYEQVMERDEWGWVNDLYFEDDGTVSAIISSAGKLYRAPCDSEGTMGEWKEVEIVYQPKRQFNVIRQDDGSYRWFAITETAVLLRVGEIDSRELFDDFIANIPENGYPTLRFFHDDRLDFGKADWVEREGNCLLASGTFDDHPLRDAFIESTERGDVWGTSNGFLPLEEPEAWEVAEGVTVPVFKRGIFREISVLPENRAASWFTSITSEVTRMRKEVAEALVKLFGDEDKARGFIENVDQTNREIEDASLVTREAATEEVSEEKHEEVLPTTEEVKPDFATVNMLEEQVRSIRESLPGPVDLSPLMERLETMATGLTTEIASLNKRLAELEKPEDQRRREWLDDQPAKPAEPIYRPRQEREADKKSLASIADATMSMLGEV